MNGERDNSGDWTWRRGLCRAVFWGCIVALILGGVLGVIARHFPLVTLNAWLRLAVGFLVPCMLFSVVHRAAGMAGSVCTALVVVLTAAIFVSQNYVFACYGVLMASGRVLTGPAWLDPEVIVLTNAVPAIGLMVAVALCHDAGSIWRTVLDLLSTHIRG